MTQDEVELKFLNLDLAKIEKKINQLGAEKKYETNTCAIFFDSDSLKFSSFDSKQKSLRLRTVDGKNILTLKGPHRGGHMKNREETEIEVDDFEKTKKNSN